MDIFQKKDKYDNITVAQPNFKILFKKYTVITDTKNIFLF